MKQELVLKDKLPDGWKWSNLKKISLNSNEGLLDGNWVLSSDMSNKKEVRLLQLADIGINKFLDVSERYVTKERAKELHARWVESGDILIARMPDPIGRACIVPDLGLPLITAVDVSILKINYLLADKSYITYYLNSQIFMNNAISLSSGSTRKRVSRKKLELIPILLPPLPVQKKIVAKLDSQMAQIEIMKKEAEKEQGASEEMFISLLAKYFPTKIKSQLPAGWRWGKLSEATDNWKDDIVSGPFGSNLVVADYRNSGIPIVRLQNVQRSLFLDKDIKYITTEKAGELKRHSFISGDLIMAKLGVPIGKTCTVPDFLKEGIIVADVVRIRISMSNSSKYFEYLLNSNLVTEQLTNQIVGSTRPRVNLDNVRDLLIPLTNLENQKKVVKLLEEFKEQCNKINETISQKLSAINELPSSLLNEVFGKYEIPEVK